MCFYDFLVLLAGGSITADPRDGQEERFMAQPCGPWWGQGRQAYGKLTVSLGLAYGTVVIHFVKFKGSHVVETTGI